MKLQIEQELCSKNELLQLVALIQEGKATFVRNSANNIHAPDMRGSVSLEGIDRRKYNGGVNGQKNRQAALKKYFKKYRSLRKRGHSMAKARMFARVRR